MNQPKQIDIMKVTRLAREGRLNDAMAELLENSYRASLFGAGGLDSETRFDPDRPRRSTPSPFGIGNLRHSGQGRMPGRNFNMPLPVGGLLEGMAQFGSTTGPVAQAPTVVPDGARFETRSYVGSAGSRQYKLFVPSRYEGQPVPVVVMLHGCKQSPDDFANGTRMNELAEEHSFLVAYPAQSASANPSRCWNWFKTQDQDRDAGEPAIIAGITREIMGDFNVQPECVSVAGLSAGGAAAAIMGATYPDLFAAVGVHSGLACGAATDMPSAFAAMRAGARDLQRHVGVRTIVFHGDRDWTVHSINGDQVMAQSALAEGLQVSVYEGQSAGGSRYTRTVYMDERGNETNEQWLIHGLGHAWSGGSSAGSYTDPRGPDASREMARFFIQRPLG